MVSTPRKKILVVDGDPDVARQVASWLKGEDIQVIAATDGETGFMRFKKEAPQVAIIAAQLDKIVGSVLCQRIKSNPASSSTIIFLASERYSTHPELGLRAVSMFGANGFLAKPLDAEVLSAALEPFMTSAAVPAAPSAPGAELAAQQVQASAPSAQPSVSGMNSLPEPPVEDAGPKKPPVLQGNLQSTPLPGLFLRLSEMKRTGVLTLERNRIRREIYFRAGLPVHATSTLRTENPALMLVRDGILSEEEYSKSLVMMTEKGMSMNEAIVASTTLTYEALYDHVRNYELEVLVNCFAWHEGHFDFRPEDKLPDSVPSFDYSALKIIHEGAGKHYPLKLFSVPIHEHKEEYAVRTARFPDLIEELDLEPAKLKFALLINGQTLVRDLVTLGRDDLYGTYKLLWTFQLARMVEFSDDPRSVKDAEFLDRAARAEVVKKPLPPDLQATILREYYRVKSSNYFRVLQVPLTAEKDQIDRAFREMEKKFHPDGLSEHDVREVQGKLNEIIEKGRAAHRVLSDERTKREYRHYLEVQERQRAKDEALQAEIAFREGESALKKSDYPTACERFEAAVKMKPDEPDYYAFLGWALFQGAKANPAEAGAAAAIKRAKQELGKAVSMNPYSDKPFLILGRVYAGEGNVGAAEEHFEKALKVNPECAPAKAALIIIRRGKENSKEVKREDNETPPG